jgi:hypothetical protein
VVELRKPSGNPGHITLSGAASGRKGGLRTSFASGQAGGHCDLGKGIIHSVVGKGVGLRDPQEGWRGGYAGLLRGEYQGCGWLGVGELWRAGPAVTGRSGHASCFVTPGHLTALSLGSFFFKMPTTSEGCSLLRCGGSQGPGPWSHPIGKNQS